MQIQFGSIAPSIAYQLRMQKLDFDKTKIANFQNDANAIVRLKIRGLLSDKEGQNAYTRLYKTIQKSPFIYNKEKKQ